MNQAVNRAVAWVSAGCWLLVAVLGVAYAGDRGAGTVDGALRGLVLRAFAGHPGVLRVLVAPTDVPVLLGVIALAAAGFLALRRWRAAVLVLGCPALAVLLTEFVLKPLIDRRYAGVLVMPSGHTVALVSVLAVLVLCGSAGTGRGLAVVLAVMLAVALAAVVLGCAAVGLVGLGYHYPADVLAGAGTAVGVVTPCWWLLTGRSLPREPLVNDPME